HIARTLPILANDLHKQLNITLHVQVCDSFSDCVDSLNVLCAANNISAVMANHEYEGNEIERDEQANKLLAKNDIEFIRWHDQCILPPKSITTNDDSMYQVFTPFYKKWRHTLEVSNIQLHKALAIDSNSNSNSNSNKAALKISKQTVNTVDAIETLSQKVVDDYQQSLADNTRLSHIDSEA
ncbi:deoxyribodipyrimidine photo-lyase, partial [Psychrobacter immobilis]